MIIIPKNVDVPLDVNKMSRLGKKIIDLLMRKTKNPVEAYAILLILKTIIEEEMGFNEEDFKSLIDEFKRKDKD